MYNKIWLLIIQRLSLTLIWISENVDTRILFFFYKTVTTKTFFAVISWQKRHYYLWNRLQTSQMKSWKTGHCAIPLWCRCSESVGVSRHGKGEVTTTLQATVHCMFIALSPIVHVAKLQWNETVLSCVTYQKFTICVLDKPFLLIKSKYLEY